MNNKIPQTTSDKMVLMIAGTICISVLTIVVVVAIISFLYPDNKGGYAAVADIVNTLISLLAGFLAGRTEASIRARHDPEGD